MACRWCGAEVEIGRSGTLRNAETFVVNCPDAPDNGKGTIRCHAFALPLAERPAMKPYRPMPDWAEAIADQAIVGCCGNAETRGNLCHYHQGLADGVEALWAALDQRGMLG